MKRGAGRAAIPLDGPAAQERCQLERADPDSPDRLYDRRWALSLLDQVLKRLEEEFHQAGKDTLFQRLQMFLVAGRGEANYPQAAEDLGMSLEAVRKAAQRPGSGPCLG